MELGVMVGIGEDTDFDAAFWQARDAGFSRGQVTFQIHGLTGEEVRRAAVSARDAGFRVDAVGCYLNPLRMDDASLTGVDSTDWRTLAENMSMLNGCERIVCWSGTFGKSLTAPNLLNGEEATFNNLFITLSGLLEQVRGLPVQIILEPYTAHVLHDAASCARMARKFPEGRVKMVLDAPNLIAAAQFAQRDALAQEMIAALAPAIGLVHLKDLALDDQKRRVFPRAGEGALDYAGYLRGLVRHLPEVPVVIEHADTLDEMRAARTFIEGLLKEYRRSS